MEGDDSFGGGFDQLFGGAGVEQAGALGIFLSRRDGGLAVFQPPGDVVADQQVVHPAVAGVVIAPRAFPFFDQALAVGRLNGGALALTGLAFGLLPAAVGAAPGFTGLVPLPPGLLAGLQFAPGLLACAFAPFSLGFFVYHLLAVGGALGLLFGDQARFQHLFFEAHD